MAYVSPVKGKSGEITSYRVKWREGGGRTDPWAGENFEDEDSAVVFKQAVDAAGQHWPEGWIKGRGYVDEAGRTEDERCRFENYARASIGRRVGAEERYRRASIGELERYVFPTFGAKDVRSPVDFSKATVSDWLMLMSRTQVWRGGQHKLMSPKTLKNLRGLLSSILKEAAEEEPPLRARNPCDSIKMPRTDDGGLDDDGEDEDKCYLTPQEVEAIVAELPRPEDKLLVRFAYATGLRWGELAALTKRHIFRDPKTGHPKVRVTRAWKRHPDDGPYLGKPKAKASRRTIRIAATTWTELVDAGLLRLAPGALVFHNGFGERLPYSTFYDRWTAAVARAKRDESPAAAEELEARIIEQITTGVFTTMELPGVDPAKHPGLHDLRHSHAAALLSEGRSLTYVQRRLGHESIETTSNTYGHLLPQADDDAMDTIERALSGSNRPAPGEPPAPVAAVGLPEQQDGRRVYAVHAGASVLGFWLLEHAEAVASQWSLDRGEQARVEAWSAPWWTRSVSGGLRAVRFEVPDRVEVWTAGPVLYGLDGAEHARPHGVDPVAAWRWEWEDGYTDELAIGHARWRPDGLTEAQAWGTGREHVIAALAEARGDALRICSMNPALATTEPGREAEV